jgi:hypothetical protein
MGFEARSDARVCRRAKRAPQKPAQQKFMSGNLLLRNPTPPRQLEKEVAGLPSVRVFVRTLQPILGAKLNFLYLFCEAKRQKRAFLFLDCIRFI